MKKWGLYIAVSLLGAVFFIFGLFNRARVDFDYILGETRWPLVFVMLLCFVSGALLTLFVFGIKFWYWRNRARSLEAMLEEEYRAQDKAQIKKEFEASRQA